MKRVIKINRIDENLEAFSSELIFVDKIDKIRKDRLQLNKSHIYITLNSTTTVNVCVDTSVVDRLYDEIENFILSSTESKLEFNV